MSHVLLPVQCGSFLNYFHYPESLNIVVNGAISYNYDKLTNARARYHT